MSDNEQLEFWNKFENTGKIEDYLNFISVSRGENFVDPNDPLRESEFPGKSKIEW